MKVRIMCLGLCVAAAVPAARAGDGLSVPAADTVWPQWQARIALQSASVSPLVLNPLLDAGSQPRGLLGGAVLGDFYFARPAFGGFRASGGLLIGAQGASSLSGAWGGSPMSLALNGSYAAAAWPASETQGMATYLGLGFTGGAWRSSLEFTADLGLVVDRPGGALGLPRALFGNQGMDSMLRDLRLSPMLQLGLRYRF